MLAGGAAILPFISRRLTIPSAVMEIVFGMALFHTVVGSQPAWFRFLKELGLIYLMFIAGMELDLRELLRNEKIAWYFVIPSLSLFLTPVFLHVAGYPYYLGIVLSMISAGIAIPVLKEAKLSGKDLGKHIIGVALAGELLSIAALTGFDIYHRYGMSLLSLLQLLKLVVLFLLGAFILKLIYLLAWWNPDQVKKVMESDDPVEEGIRIAISVVFIGALIASGAGIEPIVGSFMAGVIFSSVFRNRSRFEEKINALGFGFFLPLFFIGVGADFDVSLLLSPSGVFRALALTGVIFLSNLSVFFAKRFLGLELRKLFMMTFLLSAPLSMIVVAVTLGQRMDLINGDTANSLLLAALFASLFYPFTFRLLARREVYDTGKDKAPEN